MAQVINTNVAALFAGAALNVSANALRTAQEQLSSGLRINSVADDPTGLGIATAYQSQINGTNIAIQNANNGISTAQINDGYGAQMTANLQRLYQIAVQLGGTASGPETTALLAENARIAALTTATGAVVVNGSGGTVTGVGVAIAAPTAVTVTGISANITSVTNSRQLFGADIATFNSAVAVMQTTSVNLSASYSRIMDTDYAAATTAMTRNNILQQAGTAVLAQANQTPNTVMTLLR
jgi:flagellin